MKKVIFIILLALFSGCVSSGGPGPEPVPEANDEVEYCVPGCANLEQLSCDEGKPLLTPWECSSSAECPEGECLQGYCGVTCAQFCKETIYNGRFLGAKCWSEIKTCSEIETKCR